MAVGPPSPWLWLPAAGVTLALALGARALALRVGLVDDASDAPERKAHRAPVPLTGGVTIVAAVLAVGFLAVPTLARLGPERFEQLAGDPWLGFSDPRAAPQPAWFAGERVRGFASVLPALLVAALAGLADDLAPRGLATLPKLLGQLAAGLALAWFAAGGDPRTDPERFALCAFGAVAAMNALNTFDNSDGAAASLAGGAFLLAGSLLAPIVLALVPLALVRRRGAPLAWLGDSGSHALGILLFAHPLAWPALFLPALDLARVAWLRARAGEPPWRGDRRHLAHRLEACGRSRFAVCAWLAPIGLAPVAGWITAARGGPGWAAWAGFALGAALFAAALRVHPPEPCSAPRAER
jgi:UDP-N-acetylmuramyl pentapeptide phosphotransferase/UDP-N-acetylglucosamine-1-phosphate transferase